MYKLIKLSLVIIVFTMFLMITENQSTVFASSVRVTEEMLTNVTNDFTTEFYINEDYDEYVFAKENGEYVLECDLDENLVFCGKGNLKLDLNDRIISGMIKVDQGSNLTIYGSGEVTMGVDICEGSSVNIDSGTYKGELCVETEGSLVINNGTFTSCKKAVNIRSDAKSVIINGGEFKSEEATIYIGSSVQSVVINNGIFDSEKEAIYINTGVQSVTINGGTFISCETTVYIGEGVQSVTINNGIFNSEDRTVLTESENVTINGGIFTGKYAGIVVFGIRNITLSGGSFSVTDDVSENFNKPFKPVIVFSVEESSQIDEKLFSNILAEGCNYSRDVSIEIFNCKYQKILMIDSGSISVVPDLKKVIFDTDGGSEIKSQLVKINSKASIPEDPTKEGFDFVGWYLDEELSELFDFDKPIANDITVYAKWELKNESPQNDEENGSKAEEPMEKNEENVDSAAEAVEEKRISDEGPKPEESVNIETKVAKGKKLSKAPKPEEAVNIETEVAEEGKNSEDPKPEEAVDIETEVAEEGKNSEDPKPEEAVNIETEVAEEEKSSKGPKPEEAVNIETEVAEEEKNSEDPKPEEDVNIETEIIKEEELSEEYEGQEFVNKVPEETIKLEDAKSINEDSKDQVKNDVEGKNTTIEITTQKVDERQIQTDAEKVKSKISDREVVLAYYSINANLLVDGKFVRQVTNLDDKVTVTLDLPTDLSRVSEGYTRIFKVIRVHDGLVTELDITVNGSKFSFDSDKFSTFALTYKDVKNENLVEEKEPKTNTPKTGDRSMTLWISLGFVSGLWILVTTKSSKMRN